MVFTVQVFTLLQNQGAFQICQGGTKVPCIDAAVSVGFEAGKLCAVCAFPAALALAQWVTRLRAHDLPHCSGADMVCEVVAGA